MDSKLAKLINLCLGKNIPFVSYRLPGEKDIHTWIQLSGSFNFVEHINEVIDKKGFVYAPFHRKTNFPIAFFEPELIIQNHNVDDKLLQELSERPPLYPDFPVDVPVVTNYNDYLKQAESFIKGFNETFTKAILSRVLHFPKPEGFNAGNFFLKLQGKYPQAFCHLINIPGAGCWAGASPEILLRMDEQSAHTVSLAGTQSRIAKSSNVSWTEKEIEEQSIVTEYIENLLNQFGIAEFQKEQTKDQEAGEIVHRATRFQFDRSILKDNLAGFIQALHPTPAVCGSPKEVALDLILKTEQHNREYYAGYCGVHDPKGKTDLFVNLRTMKILPDKLALFVGGGLTAQSEAEKEWEETELKARTLLNLIESF